MLEAHHRIHGTVMQQHINCFPSVLNKNDVKKEDFFKPAIFSAFFSVFQNMRLILPEDTECFLKKFSEILKKITSQIST
jgi:hypothetical protein